MPGQPSADKVRGSEPEVTPNPNHAPQASSAFRRTREALDALDAHAATLDELGPHTTAAEAFAWSQRRRELRDAAGLALASDTAAVLRDHADVDDDDFDDFDDVPSSLPRVPCRWPERCTCDRCVDEVPR